MAPLGESGSSDFKQWVKEEGTFHKILHLFLISTFTYPRHRSQKLNYIVVEEPMAAVFSHRTKPPPLP